MASVAAIKWPPSGLPALLEKKTKKKNKAGDKKFKEEFPVISYYT